MKCMISKSVPWILSLGLMGASPRASAQDRCPHGFLDCWPNEIYTCQTEVQWSRPVDLDGDGEADLQHVRVNTHEHCEDATGKELRDLYDQTEAFFPAEHVEVWVLYNTLDEFHTYASFAVAPGEWIGDPALLACRPPLRYCRAWSADRPQALPYLQALGLGITIRVIRYYPAPFPDPGYDASAPGVIAIPENGLNFNDTVEALCGFRIRQADGWHMGWLRLHYTFNQLPLGDLEIADYAIHPEAGAPIAAGEPPRPTLRAAREEEAVVLSWSPVWSGYVLERSATLAPDSWEPVPGVTGHSVRLPAGGPPVFFRLRHE